MTARSLGVFLIQLFVLALCCIYLFKEIDFSHVPEIFSLFERVEIFFAFVFFAINFILLGVRICYIFKNEFGISKSVKASVFGMGFNNLFPAKFGEVAKIFYIHKYSSMNYPAIIGGIFWERMMDLNVLLILVVVLGMYSGTLVGGFLLLIVVAAWSVIYIASMQAEFAINVLHRIRYPTAKSFALSLLQELSLLLREKRLMQLVCITFLIWAHFFIFLSGVIYFVGDVHLSPLEYAVVFAVVVGGLAVPSTPGSVGVFEAAMTMALGWFGVEAERAFALAVLAHLIQFLPAVLLTAGMVVKGSMENQARVREA